MSKKELVVAADVITAADRIAPYVHRTPVLSSEYLNETLGCKIVFKCECFQRTSSFKARGAHNAVFAASESEVASGVIAHSSGNHGAALALAARTRGIPATIVMPHNSAAPKLASVRRLGANVVLCEPTIQSREEVTNSIIDSMGAKLVHPYNDQYVIAGQGTAALELLQDQSELEMIMAPVGGGGLMSGVSLITKHFAPNVQVIAVEPANANDAFLSWTAGRMVRDVTPKTIADGLRGQLGEMALDILQTTLDGFLTVSEEKTIEAMKLLWGELKVTTEPSSAVPLAAILSDPARFKGKKVGIILTGGNVDLDQLPWIA